MGGFDSVLGSAEEEGQEEESGVNGVTLDAGGLIALDRNDRDVLLLVRRARQAGNRVTVPATALAQVLRNPARQANLSRLIRQEDTDVVPLDGPDATAVGALLARTGTSDIVDAHVVICARRARQEVLTSDPADLRRLAPELRVVPL
jgi:hypothetical protein